MTSVRDGIPPEQDAAMERLHGAIKAALRQAATELSPAAIVLTLQSFWSWTIRGAAEVLGVDAAAELRNIAATTDVGIAGAIADKRATRH